MADAPKPPAKKGSGLTAKMGPLPVWAWAGIGVAVYFIWKQRQAASAAATAATSTQPSTAALSPAAAGNGGYGYFGPGAGFGGSGPIPTGAVATTASSYTAPTGETVQAGGFGPGSGASPTQTVTDSQGNVYQYISSPQILGSLEQSGAQLYYQPAPGVFAPQSGNLAPGTPAYQLVSSAGQPTYQGA